MTATTYHHGVDYMLLISPITMPNATGEGFHADCMLERKWNKDEKGRVLIDTLHIGRDRDCRRMMELEMEDGLTIQLKKIELWLTDAHQYGIRSRD